MTAAKNPEFDDFERLSRRLIKIQKEDLNRIRADEKSAKLANEHEPVPLELNAEDDTPT